MKTSIFRLCLLCLLVGQTAFFAVAQRIGVGHFQLGGGYKLFPGMSNVSGWNYSFSCRYHLTEKYYAVALLHMASNKGHYTKAYKGGELRLSHREEGAFIGAGPGVYLLDQIPKLSVYAQCLLGYSRVELVGNPNVEPVSSDQISEERRSVAGALMVGVERGSMYIIGANAGLYYMGRRIRPAINLTWGFYFDL